jgi:hypothetical protein
MYLGRAGRQERAAIQAVPTNGLSAVSLAPTNSERNHKRRRIIGRWHIGLAGLA